MVERLALTRRLPAGACALALLLAVGPALADEVQVGGESGFVPLTPDKPYLHVVHDGRSIKVQRVQDPNYELKGYYARTVRKCPPFCIQPITPDPTVQVIGEVELFDFMESELRDGKGLLIDARTPAWYQKGTIPGSVNYPFTLLSKEPGDPQLDALMETFGAKRRGEVGFFTRLLEEWDVVDTSLVNTAWDFSDAKKLVLWCNGPACGQSPRAIRGLLAAGYPASKLFYYRGGMQLWQLWGLTTVVPK